MTHEIDGLTRRLYRLRAHRDRAASRLTALASQIEDVKEKIAALVVAEQARRDWLCNPSSEVTTVGAPDETDPV